MGVYKDFKDPGPKTLQGWMDWLLSETDESGRSLLLPVLPNLAAACTRCYGSGIVYGRTHLCDWCQSLAEDPLDGFVSVSYSLHGGLESLLATTKKHYYGVKVWQRSAIAALVYSWLDKHFNCIYDHLGANPKVVRVPSATDRPDHLGYIWGRFDALNNSFPIDFDVIYRVIGSAKPARRTVAPEHYRIPVSVQGRDFLLIDDIYTSGAQMRSVAAKLKEYGARKVIGLAIGRTLNESSYGNNQLIVNQSATRKWDINVCRYCESE
jgi:hypothetical protein